VNVAFADAGYFIANLDSRDPLHERARTVAADLGVVSTVTTHMVIVEVLNYVSRGGEHLRRLAVQMVRDLEARPDVEIVSQNDARFTAAVERYAARSDQTWSLTDCASFLVMEERNITEALAYDRDFEQAGFTALLR
jgi:predicted nucleic acid-binding protein